MGVQLIFVVEANKSCKSDWIYIKSTIDYFYEYNRTGLKLSPVYMDGKGKYKQKEKEVKSLISQYSKASKGNKSKVRFIYDSVFQAYDCYFLKDRIKSYKCPVCNRIYDEKEVAQVKVKRCFECDEKLEEIIHKDVPISDGNYTEVEVKILGIIATLSKEDAMSAAEISAAVGCNIQKVAIWGSKVLAKKGLINIEKREARNYYYDKVD